jgi:glutamate transport system permease protein
MTWLTDNWGEILVAFGVTVEMTVMAGIIAMVVGFALAALRVSPIPLGRAVGAAYVRIVRNTPLLLIMLIFAFGLPELDIRPEFHVAAWFGSASHSSLVNFDVFFVFATSALGLYTAAFVCEAVRSGINSVPPGQAEAARAVGLTFQQTLGTVVLPQALRTVVPPLGSVIIAMIKNSAIVGAFGVTGELFSVDAGNTALGYSALSSLTGVAIAYLVITIPAGLLLGYIERRIEVKR